MVITIPRPKTLILLALVLLSVFALVRAGVISAAPPAETWLTTSEAISDTDKSTMFDSLPSVLQDYVTDGHSYLVIRYQHSGHYTCNFYVATSGTLEFSFFAANHMRSTVVGGSQDRYSVTDCDDITDLSGLTYGQTTSGALSQTNSGLNDYFREVLAADGITATSYHADYTALSPSRPEPTPAELTALAFPLPTTYDDLITISQNPMVAYPYADNDPYAAVTGHTNDRCHDTNYDQSFLNWYSLFNSIVVGLPDGSQKTEAEGFLDYLDDAILGSGGWGVLHDYSEDGDYHRTIIMTWTGTPDLEFVEVDGEKRFRFNGSNNSLRYYMITPVCSIFNTDDPEPTYSIGTMSQPSSGDLYLDSLAVTSLTMSAITHTPAVRAIVFMSGQYTLDYPIDYKGNEIPNTAPEDQYFSRTYTDFDVHMNSFSLRATYNGNTYDDPKCTFISWRYILVSDPEDIYDPADVNQAYTTIGQDLSWTAPDTGFYRLDAQWSWAATDSEFTNAGLDLSDKSYCQQAVIFGSGHISLAYEAGDLPMNSGKVFPVDGLSSEIYSYSLNRECEIDDQAFVETGFYPPSMLCVYETDWTLKDCSEYGIDELHHRLGCEFGNFTKQLRFTMIAFFIPSPEKLQSTFSALTNDIQEHTSFLTYPIQFIIVTIEEVVSEDADCTVNYSGIFGQSGAWDLCRMKTDWPAAWTFATTIFRLSLVLVFILATYKAFMRLWSKQE